MRKLPATVHEFSSVHVLSQCVHKEGKCVCMVTKTCCFLMTEGYQSNYIKSKSFKKLCA